MSADALIAKLEKVKRTGNGTWLACCPAHGDTHPSMSVRETEDGRVLVHCFAGCDVGQIVGAVGLSLEDLFPPKPICAVACKPLRRPFPAADVLEAVAFECMVVAVHAGDLAQGKPLSDEERKRLWVAFDRIQQARSLALG